MTDVWTVQSIIRIHLQLSTLRHNTSLLQSWNTLVRICVACGVSTETDMCVLCWKSYWLRRVFCCLTLVIVHAWSFLPSFYFLSPLFLLFLHWAHTPSGIFAMCLWWAIAEGSGGFVVAFMTGERKNTIVCSFDLRSPRITAFEIHECLYESLKLHEQDP